MRLVSYRDGDAVVGGVLVDGGAAVVPLSALVPGGPATVRGLLASHDRAQLAELAVRAEEAADRLPLAGLELLAPVPDPAKIICLALNYRSHAAEANIEVPQNPSWFTKYANSLLGDGGTVVLPEEHDQYVDYEAELAVVIGRRAKRVSEEDALDHVAGAMAFNDVSARDLQLQSPQWNAGKAVDTFAPCGPALVLMDEIADLQDLELTTHVNGKLLQRGHTSDQVFSVAHSIAWLSRTITLEPGDIIATGTPAGIGSYQNVFLRDGDTVAVGVTGLGTVTNRVAAEVGS
jgi:2-keto-4-pentenoate hydratase/2-oxohepta-3-ene-1,7-dioic acid hydratase in catechol pathway